MHFIFSAPFRTGINLNSLVSMNANGNVVEQIFSSLVEVQSQLPKGFDWEVPWAKNCENELHYSELSEDLIPLSATPLLRLRMAIDPMRVMMQEKENFKEIQVDSIESCFIEYYDNTVAILFIDANLSFPDGHKSGFQVLDRWSTGWCAEVINEASKFDKHLQNVLVNRKNNKKKIFLKPEEFKVFFDQYQNHKRDAPAIDKLLWVTRVFLSSKDDPGMALLEEWTQQVDLTCREKKIGGARIAFCIGNSVVFNEIRGKEYIALTSAMAICTYFYVLHDVINRNLKIIFIDLSNENSANNSMASRVNKVRGHIEFIENEFSDVLLGLQGMRSQVATHLLDTWKYTDLIKSVQNKKETVGKMLDFSMRQQQGRYARIVEAILAAIGGVAVLDFALNLFAFTNYKQLSEDSIPGLVDAVKYLPPDGVFYAIITLILAILILVIKKREYL